MRRDGTVWVNPITNQVTTFAFPGDPETGTGWVMPGGDDRRLMQCFGPFTINPNDTQSIVVAQMIARGTNNLKSVTSEKIFRNIKSFYKNNFRFPGKPSSPLVSSYAPGNGKIYLTWNDSAERICIQTIFPAELIHFRDIIFTR